MASPATCRDIKQTAKRLFPHMAEQERVCPEHGTYVAIRYRPHEEYTTCPACYKAAEAAAKAEEAELGRRLEQERKWRGSGIPERYLQKGFDDFQHINAQAKYIFDEVRSYAASLPEAISSGRCLVLSGRHGTGKTHLAVGLIKSASKLGYSVHMTRIYNAIARVKETWGAYATESEAQAIRFYSNVDLLVLDEIGVQFGSVPERIIFFQILDNRYSNLRPTVIISNEDQEGLKLFLGERIYDRLRENGGKILVFDWESYRGKKDGET